MFSAAHSEDISQRTSVPEPDQTSVSNRDDQNSNCPPTRQQSREITANMLIKEFIICLVLALTTFGAFHNSPTKISKHPPAVRFFRDTSLIQDWYKGDLTNALASINNADISFVMYYAPWDAECQNVRHEFEKTAQILSDKVHFSAINCWNPGSECKAHHSKIPSWPVIMAYTINSRGVIYLGPRDAQSMVKFLELVMKPLNRVAAAEDLVNLLATCEAVAVGYTPLAESPKYYNIWYSVSLKAREIDPIGEICFASVTSDELAMELGVESLPNARLMLWNETKEFQGDLQSWNETTLVRWLLHDFSQPVERIVPLWKKAFSFQRVVDGNPLLILFTPLNLLYEQLPSFDLLREVAMEYYDCIGNQWTQELMKLQHVQRMLYQQKNTMRFCESDNVDEKYTESSYYKQKVLAEYHKYSWYNSTQKNQKTGMFGFLLKRGLVLSNDMKVPNIDILYPDESECGTDDFANDRDNQCYKFGKEFQNFQILQNLVTTMLPQEDDPLSAEKLLQDNVKHHCKIMRFAQQFGPPVFPARDRGTITNISGLACQYNVTLNMIAIDSVRNYHFAESLGIDIVNKKDKTAVVILDNKHESQYILKEDYSANSIREFILNFTNEKLSRSLRTHVQDALHTHYFDAYRNFNASLDDGNYIRVNELTTNTFRKFVRMPDTLGMVCVCGGACPSSVTRSLLAAARLLRCGGVRCAVGRLDALRHDLPWQYTAHAHPALIVFTPHSRRGVQEAESRVYPFDRRVSAGGLVALALRSLSAPEHVRVRLALCRNVKIQYEKRSCLRDLRNHVVTLIGRNLKYWRRFRERRLKEAFFKRLLYLHPVHFSFNLLHITDLITHNEKHKSLIVSLDNLARNWHIDISLLKRNVTVESRTLRLL